MNRIYCIIVLLSTFARSSSQPSVSLPLSFSVISKLALYRLSNQGSGIHLLRYDVRKLLPHFCADYLFRLRKLPSSRNFFANFLIRTSLQSSKYTFIICTHLFITFFYCHIFLLFIPICTVKPAFSQWYYYITPYSCSQVLFTKHLRIFFKYKQPAAVWSLPRGFIML